MRYTGILMAHLERHYSSDNWGRIGPVIKANYPGTVKKPERNRHLGSQNGTIKGYFGSADPDGWKQMRDNSCPVHKTFRECLDPDTLERLARDLDVKKIRGDRDVGRRVEDTFPNLDELLEGLAEEDGRDKLASFLRQYIGPEEAQEMSERLYSDMARLEERRQAESELRRREAELESKPWPGGYKGVL